MLLAVSARCGKDSLLLGHSGNNAQSVVITSNHLVYWSLRLSHGKRHRAIDAHIVTLKLVVEKFDVAGVVGKSLWIVAIRLGIAPNTSKGEPTNQESHG